MKASRKPVFYFLSAVYIIACPLLILWSFGFFSDTANPGPQSAGVYINTLPEGASVSLNGRKFSQVTPVALSPLLPGAYRIDLELSRHQKRSYAVNLRPGQQMAISKSLFLGEDLKAKRLVRKNFEDLIPLGSGDSFIVREGDNLGDYFFYNYDKHILVPFSQSSLLPIGGKIISIFTLKNSSAVFLSCNVFGVKKYFFLELKADRLAALDISQFVSAEPVIVAWDFRDSGTLFAFNGDYIDRIDIREGASQERFLENVRGLGVAQGQVYVVTDINNVQRYDYLKENVKNVINDQVLADFIFANQGIFNVEVLFQDTILFRGADKGDLSLNKPPYRFVPGGVKGTLFDPLSRRLLLWQNERIGMIDFSGKGSTLDKSLRVNWFFQGAQDIEQGFWVYDASHVLARDRDEVFIFELNPAGKSSFQPLVGIKSLTSVYYSEAKGSVYYLDPANGNLLVMNIIPLASQPAAGSGLGLDRVLE